MARIGIFICHCGENISGTVDCVQLAQTVASFPGVVHSVEYSYLCSDPGQEVIVEAIQTKKLTGIVVAACSPRMHESTFKRACLQSGLHPSFCEMVNLQEYEAWGQEKAYTPTERAIELLRVAVAKVVEKETFSPAFLPIKKTALVVGGGIGGLEAALTIAQAGYPVILIEREYTLGGRMAQLYDIAPTLENAQSLVAARIAAVKKHPKITVYTGTELQECKGSVGKFQVKILKKARGVDTNLCTGCGLCERQCPVQKISASSLGNRSAIFLPREQGAGSPAVLDKKNCTYFSDKSCTLCEKACPTKAIRYDEIDQTIEKEVGAIVLATGFDVLTADFFLEYGSGKYKDVITALEFESLLSPSGPTGGVIHRPSDGKIPGTVAFLCCAGSRDAAKGRAYCSKICCLYTAKQAMGYRHQVPQGKAYVFYMDIRTPGKMQEEFLRRVIEQDRVKYIRSRVSLIQEKDGKLLVQAADTLLEHKPIELEVDMVVLATAVIANDGAEDLARKLRITCNPHHFFTQAHSTMQPAETNTQGVFLVGACEAPKGIADTICQAGAATAKVLTLFAQTELDLSKKH